MATPRERRARWRSVPTRALGSFVAAAVAMAWVAPATADGPPVMAVVEFDFRDTSGEPSDQEAEHDARLRAFALALRDGFSSRSDVAVAALPCEPERCSPVRSGLATLMAEARAADAGYLLLGEVHKMSTLVGWVRLAVVEVGQPQPLCERVLSYRGDTDAAWQRAAVHTIREVERHCLPSMR